MIKVNKIFYLFICAIVFLYTSILHAAVDIVVNENDSPDPIAAGGTLTYTLNVANNGPDDSTGVSLTAALPATVSLQVSFLRRGHVQVQQQLLVVWVILIIMRQSIL